MNPNRTPRRRFPLTPLALAVLGAVHEGSWAQQDEAVGLKPTPALREDIPAQVRGQQPSFVFGDRITGRPDLDTTIEGDAEMRRGDTVIRAQRLEYWQPDDLAKARGNVRINRAGNVIEGPYLELQVDAFEGFFTQPNYRFLRNEAYGQASRVDFIDENRMVVRDATYTTCQREDYPGWMPAWILRAGGIRLDQEEEVGVATDAVLSFYNVPILPIPRLSFPLSDKRKSGLLPPVIGIDSLNGIEYRQPYYWNIAPNRDATLYPSLMSKRGVDLGAEFRYLESTYRGEVQANYMPGDRLRDMDRWGYHLRHDGALPGGPLGTLGLSLNLNRVSDDNYWRDFSRTSASLTQRLLASDGLLQSNVGNWYFLARTLSWQTLQDVTSPITPPYDMLPQLLARHTRQDLPLGLESSVELNSTRFDSVRELTGQPNAQRSFMLGALQRPWQAPGWFLIPRVQLHSTYYSFDAPLTNGRLQADRTLPIYSVDSGLVFERPTSFLGRNFLQTLEPRAFYVYTPFREQSLLPNYDSGFNDFNFATIFTENSFGGHDRIADNNLLTVGATTRLVDPDTGAEAAKFAIAQRLRFKDQRVTLPGGQPVSERLSDLLFGASINWDPRWTFDGTVQYNPKTRRSERVTVGGRYNPSPYRVVSAAYRLQRELSEQIDVGWQWPLNDLWGDRGLELGPGRGQGGGRWYSVGRLNFSLRDKRVVDSVLGLEYDACCWIGRVVVERLQSNINTSNKRIMFQLEFIGFSRLGSNALGTLRQNIPRYQLLRDPNLPAPSRFTNYD
ncbi:LPS-assembly protein LptD [Ramlibacter henchirensis]|uniref:LPS-assembly protein LptD n=1 Tax=Ramlibacter henchirensis TaxID=204072 RepID=UPI0019810400